MVKVLFGLDTNTTRLGFAEKDGLGLSCYLINIGGSLSPWLQQ